MKLWLIQPGLAPYRIPLFAEIARHPGVDLTVVLQAERLPGHPWRFDPETLPFRTLLIRSFKWRRNYEMEVYFSPSLIWHLLRMKPDVVVCNGFTMATLVLLVPMILTRTRYVIWNEGTRYSDAGISPLKAWLRRLMARFASGFIIAGRLSREYTEEFLPRGHPAKFHLSYNCVDNQRFMSLDRTRDRTERRARLDKSFPSRNILFIGKLIERKGIPQLLEAYKAIRQQGRSDVGLIMLGDGPLKAYVEEFVASHGLSDVFLEGFVPQERILDYYLCADVFALLSIADPNPLVIFEALAAGIPIVCSYKAGNSVDFIREGENGYIVDPLDIPLVTDKLLRSLDAIEVEHAATLSRELVQQANYPDSAKAFVEAAREACHPKDRA